MDRSECCRCSQRKKERSPEEYKKLIHRLNRIEGQIRGIRSMVESGAYCPDILVQAAAVNAAVNAFNKELLAAHIRTCVAEDIRAGRDETIDEQETERPEQPALQLRRFVILQRGLRLGSARRGFARAL